MTVRTAFLEARWLWGDDELFDAAMRRFRKEVVAGTAAEFVAAKLAERDQRHVSMGDSRYVVEPNVKDGKGGLRDLHTLYWIGKYVHGVERPPDLVGAGPVDRRRIPPLRPRRALLLVGALPSAPARRTRRGAAELRLSAAHRRDHALRRPAREIGGRAVHAILFHQRQGGRRPDRRVPRPARRATGQEGLPLRAADHPPAAQAPRRLHARPRPAVDPGRRFLPRRSGAPARAVRAGRARAARNPPDGDARRHPRRAR